jgi:anti-anti-sigma factor
MALVQVSQAQGHVPVTIFLLQDRVNLGNYTELENAAQDEFGRGMRRLVIDLSQTPSLTSIGVRALIVIHKMLAADRGNNLKLAGPSPAIREMLEIAGVTPPVEVYDSVEEAVASF